MLSRLDRVIGAACMLLATSLAAQSASVPLAPDQSAAQLDRLVRGLTVTPRVLVIGLRPEDEDSGLIAWLSRGHQVETAYLSITRGEGGSNFGGSESGSSLGAIRTQEALAARRIDGAKQFFTRAYDFGFARDTVDVLKHWNRDSVVGDIVAVIRSFRPHVIVEMLSDSLAASDGRYAAFDQFLEWALLASDAARYGATVFGTPWRPLKVYRYGPGLRIETSGYDRVAGASYEELALRTRVQQRSQGLFGATAVHPAVVELSRVGPRIGVNLGVDQSFFGGLDTSFTRLAANAPPAVAAVLPAIVAYADSAHRALDLGNPATIVPYLAQVARLAVAARDSSPWCQHPSRLVDPPRLWPESCNPKSLDLDASLDLVRARSTDALFAAAEVSIVAAADRELVAESDTAVVTVSLANHGAIPVTLDSVAVLGSPPSAMEPIVVPPGGEVHVTRRVTGLADSRPWWIGPRGGASRGGDRYSAVGSTIDGLSRKGLVLAPLRTLGVAVPENFRRSSDVEVTITIASVPLTTSLGPPLYRHADAQVGLQNRPLAGVPDVTLQVARGLDWIPRNKQVTRALPLLVESHADRDQDIALHVLAPSGVPAGLHVDSLPRSLHLGPHEARELFVQLSGKLEATERSPIGAGATPLATLRDSTVDPATRIYETGFQTIQRDYLPPIRLFGTSGEWIQPIAINVPPGLTAMYVPGARDDIASALAEVGVWTREVMSAEELPSVELSSVSTIVVGPGAFEAKPELLGQVGRLLEFVRKGGTLVVLRGGNLGALQTLLPYPVALAQPLAERVSEAEAPVTVLDSKARLLNWPNKIGAADWTGWVGGRAQWMPSSADPRYARVVELHDRDQPENRNAILVAHVGKGVIVYTTLTLDTQIAGGVGGGLRLLVNLLSAGLTPAP